MRVCKRGTSSVARHPGRGPAYLQYRVIARQCASPPSPRSLMGCMSQMHIIHSFQDATKTSAFMTLLMALGLRAISRGPKHKLDALSVDIALCLYATVQKLRAIVCGYRPTLDQTCGPKINYVSTVATARALTHASSTSPADGMSRLSFTSSSSRTTASDSEPVGGIAQTRSTL
ncbi:hypothetical protein FA95DRAFT_562408 [Auriscalpium vulgare]|uniref:Uncharacterized protein n=1 Tax=Auriscalpium vulgare TaxID=40419 RepID=A0ACB8REU0_9AGAM|nr:hypothetical protein FA95DRAFT_562408 [Auriscalpium vulgare]